MSNDVKRRELNYLSHHGILGQKWGVRRFQNKDGTLTELGKKEKSKLNKLEKYDKKITKINKKVNKKEKRLDFLKNESPEDLKKRVRKDAFIYTLLFGPIAGATISQGTANEKTTIENELKKYDKKINKYKEKGNSIILKLNKKYS